MSHWNRMPRPIPLRSLLSRLGKTFVLDQTVGQGLTRYLPDRVCLLAQIDGEARLHEKQSSAFARIGTEFWLPPIWSTPPCLPLAVRVPGHLFYCLLMRPNSSTFSRASTAGSWSFDRPWNGLGCLNMFAGIVCLSIYGNTLQPSLYTATAIGSRVRRRSAT